MAQLGLAWAETNREVMGWRMWLECLQTRGCGWHGARRLKTRTHRVRAAEGCGWAGQLDSWRGLRAMR